MSFSALRHPFFLTLMAPVILLPSTRTRHRFFCFWELQISSELALEEMGGDRSGRRWGDRLASMFELALTQGGRESMLGESQRLSGTNRSVSVSRVTICSRSNMPFQFPPLVVGVLRRRLQPGRHLHVCHPASSISKVSWVRNNEQRAKPLGH